jgi:dehydrogenase/reductase SDR family member 1
MTEHDQPALADGTPQAAGPLGDKVAIVIGASRGIGKGVAIELALAGAFVVVVGRTLDPLPGPIGSLSETVASIADVGGRAMAVRCDVTDDDDIAGMVARVRAAVGRLDVLVNAAFDTPGFRSSINIPFWELPVSIWRDVVDLGSRSVYVACVQATPLLLEGGGGLIVNVSGRGAESYRYNVAYGVGKAAVDRMTRDMAHEVSDRGIAIVSVWPGLTHTEHMDAMLAQGDAWARVNLGEVEAMETPRYLGRCIAALAADPDVMTRSGRRFWTAELASAYGVTDEHGRVHSVPGP